MVLQNLPGSRLAITKRCVNIVLLALKSVNGLHQQLSKFIKHNHLKMRQVNAPLLQC